MYDAKVDEHILSTKKEFRQQYKDWNNDELYMEVIPVCATENTYINNSKC